MTARNVLQPRALTSWLNLTNQSTYFETSIWGMNYYKISIINRKYLLSLSNVFHVNSCPLIIYWRQRLLGKYSFKLRKKTWNLLDGCQSVKRFTRTRTRTRTRTNTHTHTQTQTHTHTNKDKDKDKDKDKGKDKDKQRQRQRQRQRQSQRQKQTQTQRRRRQKQTQTQRRQRRTNKIWWFMPTSKCKIYLPQNKQPPDTWDSEWTTNDPNLLQVVCLHLAACVHHNKLNRRGCGICLFRWWKPW